MLSYELLKIRKTFELFETYKTQIVKNYYLYIFVKLVEKGCKSLNCSLQF